MHIKKLSHCCLVIGIPTKGGKQVRLVMDPGSYSIEQHDKISHADIVLITHEHQDHFHLESLRSLVKRSPGIAVITNDSVGEILAKEGIEHKVMKHGNAVDVKGVHIEAYGKDHAIIHKSLPTFSNVGFFIENRFFFPGDAFTDPQKPVDVLALPVAGPWMKISESIDYALALKPRMAFPVHDGGSPSVLDRISEKVFGGSGIEYIKLENGGEIEVK